MHLGCKFGDFCGIFGQKMIKNRIEFRSRFWDRFWPPRGALQGKKLGFSSRGIFKIEGRPFGAQVLPRSISETKMKPKRSQNGAQIDQKSLKIRGRVSEGKNDAADALRGRLWKPKRYQNCFFLFSFLQN